MSDPFDDERNWRRWRIADARDLAFHEAFRRVRVDREIMRCMVESRRVLMGYEWPSYG